MQLAEYLEAHGISQVEFADKIGVTPGRVSQLTITGLASLRRTMDIIRRIERATGGKVTAKDWLRHERAA